MANGWIKLHRCLLDSAVFTNPDLLKVWVWCLLKASHKGHQTVVGLQTVELEEGQFIFGRKVAGEELKMNESKVYRLIKQLESLGNVNIKPNNKYSLVTIEKWGLYQDGFGESEQQSEQQMNNKRTTDEQQMNTNKNVKNDKNVKNVKNNIYAQVPEELVIPLKEFEKHRKNLKAPLTDHGLKLLISKLQKLSGGNVQTMIAILNQSIEQGWKGVFELSKPKKPRNEVLAILESGVLDD